MRAGRTMASFASPPAAAIPSWMAGAISQTSSSPVFQTHQASAASQPQRIQRRAGAGPDAAKRPRRPAGRG